MIRIIIIALLLSGCTGTRAYLGEKLTPSYVELDTAQLSEVVALFSSEYSQSRTRIMESRIMLTKQAQDRLKEADKQLIIAAGQVQGISIMNSGKVKLNQRQLYQLLKPTLHAARNISQTFDEYKDTLSEADRQQYEPTINGLNEIIEQVENSMFNIKSELNLMELLNSMRSVISLFT